MILLRVYSTASLRRLSVSYEKIAALIYDEPPDIVCLLYGRTAAAPATSSFSPLSISSV